MEDLEKGIASTVGRWITVAGRHIFIKPKGTAVSTVVREGVETVSKPGVLSRAATKVGDTFARIGRPIRNLYLEPNKAEVARRRASVYAFTAKQYEKKAAKASPGSALNAIYLERAKFSRNQANLYNTYLKNNKVIDVKMQDIARKIDIGLGAGATVFGGHITAYTTNKKYKAWVDSKNKKNIKKELTSANLGVGMNSEEVADLEKGITSTVGRWITIAGRHIFIKPKGAQAVGTAVSTVVREAAATKPGALSRAATKLGDKLERIGRPVREVFIPNNATVLRRQEKLFDSLSRMKSRPAAAAQAARVRDIIRQRLKNPTIDIKARNLARKVDIGVGVGVTALAGDVAYNQIRNITHPDFKNRVNAYNKEMNRYLDAEDMKNTSPSDWKSYDAKVKHLERKYKLKQTLFGLKDMKKELTSANLGVGMNHDGHPAEVTHDKVKVIDFPSCVESKTRANVAKGMAMAEAVAKAMEDCKKFKKDQEDCGCDTCVCGKKELEKEKEQPTSEDLEKGIVKLTKPLAAAGKWITYQGRRILIKPKNVEGGLSTPHSIYNPNKNRIFSDPEWHSTRPNLRENAYQPGLAQTFRSPKERALAGKNVEREAPTEALYADNKYQAAGELMNDFRNKFSNIERLVAGYGLPEKEGVRGVKAILERSYEIAKKKGEPAAKIYVLENMRKLAEKLAAKPIKDIKHSMEDTDLEKGVIGKIAGAAASAGRWITYQGRRIFIPIGKPIRQNFDPTDIKGIRFGAIKSEPYKHVGENTNRFYNQAKNYVENYDLGMKNVDAAIGAGVAAIASSLAGYKFGYNTYKYNTDPKYKDFIDRKKAFAADWEQWRNTPQAQTSVLSTRQKKFNELAAKYSLEQGSGYELQKPGIIRPILRPTVRDVKKDADLEKGVIGYAGKVSRTAGQEFGHGAVQGVVRGLAEVGGNIGRWITYMGRKIFIPMKGTRTAIMRDGTKAVFAAREGDVTAQVARRVRMKKIKRALTSTEAKVAAGTALGVGAYVGKEKLKKEYD